MEGSAQVPPEIQQIADNLGVDVHELIAKAQEAAASGAVAPPAGAAPAQAQAQVVPTETEIEQLQRELAESQAETQQVRRLAQVAEEGRVVGSGGGGVAGQAEAPPNLANLEPGIKWSYFNGLISDEDLIQKVGPLLANLLKAHEGGAA
jgi:pyruvate/2-oxoglutarate dehydrogenase complex dihydrolipoamide acyltransferase (E2) component